MREDVRYMYVCIFLYICMREIACVVNLCVQAFVLFPGNKIVSVVTQTNVFSVFNLSLQ